MRLLVEQEEGAWLDLERVQSPAGTAVPTVVHGGHRPLREALREVLGAMVPERWVGLEDAGASGSRAALLRLLLEVEEASTTEVEGESWSVPTEITLGLRWAPRSTCGVDRQLLEVARRAWGPSSRRLGPLRIASHPRVHLEPAALLEELGRWSSHGPEPLRRWSSVDPESIGDGWLVEVSWDLRLWVWEHEERRWVAWWETSA